MSQINKVLTKERHTKLRESVTDYNHRLCYCCNDDQQSEWENWDSDPLCIWNSLKILTQKSDILITSRGATREKIFMKIDPGESAPQIA